MMPIMDNIIGIYLFTVVLLLLLNIDGFIKYMSFTMIGVAIFILALKKSSFQVWVDSVGINHTLVALFVSVPLLGITVKSEQYIEALKGLYVNYLYRPTIFAAVTQLLTHGMSIVLNMGAVSIFYYLSADNPVVSSPRFITTALIRGFANAIMWSPFFAAMALVTNQLQLEWVSALPFLLGFVAISFLVSFILDLIEYKKVTAKSSVREIVATEEAKMEPTVVNWSKIIELFLLLVAMVVFVFIFDSITSLRMPTIVIISAFLFPTVWLLFNKKRDVLYAEGKQYVTTTVPLFQKETVLFLTTGFFSGAVSQTSFGQVLASFLVTFFQDFTIGISLFIAVSIIVFSLIGFHPIMLITLYVTSVDPAALGMSVVHYAVLLLGAWGLATPVSPMTAVSHMLANLTRQKVIDVSFRWNITYCVCGLMLLIIYVTLLSAFQII